jgi:hypothetical protein
MQVIQVATLQLLHAAGIFTEWTEYSPATEKMNKASNNVFHIASRTEKKKL